MHSFNKPIVLVAILLCSACAQQPSAPGTDNLIELELPASGSVRLQQHFWIVRDVVAFNEKNKLHVVLTDTPFNQEDLAMDGKLDSFDIVRHNGDTMTLKFDAKGPDVCVDLKVKAREKLYNGSTCRSAFISAIKINQRSPERIEGSMTYGNRSKEHVLIQFVAPIQDKLERVGEPLAVDGGEPGRAVLEHFKANASGDFDKIKAQTNPKRLAVMSVAKLEEIKRMTKLLQEMTPTHVKVQGGVINGDTAIVDFSGLSSGDKIKGVAKLSRYRDQWYVDETNETILTSKEQN